ncbi:Autophagy protein 7 [Lithohypha guttulata]|nr:Autophagy protein 7 [Lithohypha guttulata]
MQYVPFISDIEIPFYASLARQKIDHDKLDSSPKPIRGLYEIRPNDPREQSCRMQIHGNALKATATTDAPSTTTSNTNTYHAPGTIRNVNTIEDYRNLDKSALIQAAGKQIWDAINDDNGSIYVDPSILASFLVISFADLKKYRFSYWFAFPALVMDPPWGPVMDDAVAASTKGTEYVPKVLSTTESGALVEEVEAWKESVDGRQHGFFVAKKSRRSGGKTANQQRGEQQPQYAFSQLGFRWVVDSLAAYEKGFFEGEYSDDCYVCFADPSNYTSQGGRAAPGWMLRNLLALVRQRWKRDRMQILCYRETVGRREAARSVVYDMELSRPKDRSNSSSLQVSIPPSDMPKVVGWERNAAGKLAGRLADLTEYMDPTKLADSSVDLNLKLMKWRISPNLDLEKIKNTRCLLLGAGTLGSYVSRNLLGWGVRKITFVDNATVSYSNPVRQPLFNFQDCLNGGKQKAVRAAEALKEIYPGVEAEGHVMSVPMIGHPVTDSAKTRGEFEKLQNLVNEHDVIFLLMDTRESRWLPTVMGKAAGKTVMNAALGFDTYVVMRHGSKVEKDSQQELGCYFCNDVVAPQDSMQDRTLDQQCTVTRPGVAAIASASLVELLASVLQHPDGARAAAPKTANDDRGEHPLGLVPHQIRGFLSNFTSINVIGQSYDCCSACSDRVLDEYKQDGWIFVEKALNSKDYVEELSGLKEVHRRAEAAAAEIEAAFEEGDDDLEGSEGEML